MKSRLATLEQNTIQKIRTKNIAPILVFGDIILDSYIEGKVSRISPEAPVPVLYNPGEEKFVLGGAANVAHNLVTLRNSVRLVSGIGRLPGQPEADILLDLLRAKGISTDYIVTLDRKTTYKKRVLAGKQQLLRIDTEDPSLISKEEETKVMEALHKASEGISAIIISDYAKGMLTEDLAAAIGDIAAKKSIPLLADIKLSSLDKLSNVSLLKPNLKEAEEFTGIKFTGNMSQIAEMAEKLQKRFSSQILVTCGNLGMVAHNKEEINHIITPPKEVFDVSGAGDTVIAALAHGFVRGVPLEDSASLASIAAGIAISHPGTVAVKMDEIETQLSKTIVPKTWGHEEWIVNADYCGKKLVLNEGHCCSLHYHKIKDETFYIASGQVGFQMNDQFFILLPGDSILITPGTKHRFYGLMHSEIFEFSTHHMEEDSYRDEVSGTFEKSLFLNVPDYRSLAAK